MDYTRKDLRNITGLPDKTLRWLLDKLDIQPVDFKKTFFGSPIYIYDDSALEKLHEYIFVRNLKREESARGKRCRGGCGRYIAPEFLNSAQICDHCRRRMWVLNEVTHRDPLGSAIDGIVIEDLNSIIAEFSAK